MKASEVLEQRTTETQRVQSQWLCQSAVERAMLPLCTLPKIPNSVLLSHCHQFGIKTQLHKNVLWLHLIFSYVFFVYRLV